MSEITITAENFEQEVLESDKPVLLDFWAPWCGPCQMLAPIISDIAEEKRDTVKVGKVHVDEQPELAIRFRVNSIPTVIVIKDGRITNTSVGFRTKEMLLDMLA